MSMHNSGTDFVGRRRVMFPTTERRPSENPDLLRSSDELVLQKNPTRVVLIHIITPEKSLD